MLSEREQSYYAELFQTCDVDGTGKFTGIQVSDLFRSSGLGQDVLLQITELCGAKRLGHFGRSQFYIALKLIAAAQCGLPVSHESINAGMDIPLPKFHKMAHGADTGAQFSVSAGTNDIAIGSERQQQGQLPPPPTPAKKSHGRNLSGQFRSLPNDAAPLQIIPQQTPAKDGPTPEAMSPTMNSGVHPLANVVPPTQITSTPQSPPTSPQGALPGPRMTIPTSPTTSVTNSQSQNSGTNVTASQHPGPQLGVGKGVASAELTNHKKGTEEWARFESDDEKHGLLGSGKKEGWDDLKLPAYDSSSYSSDTDSVEDVWTINDEQREYYVKQFQNVEPDINGMITGHVAKDFFEKSKLSNHELSKIWNLADINKDGALSLEEFCIAMHLVVLRRNEVEIPDRLPFSLMPYNAFTNEGDHEPFAADLPQGSTLKRLTPTSPGSQGGQWGMIPESPQISSSEVSSPSVTPANFDFQKPEPADSNPEAHIVQPKARRLSPETLTDITEGRPERDPVPCSGDGIMHDSDPTHPVLTKQRSNTTSNTEQNSIDATNASLQGRPRPKSVKINTVPAIPGHILPPVTNSNQLENSMSVDGVEPPVPPPRPGQHGRSMSVDYKAPPAVPPRISPKEPQSAKKLSQFKQNFEPIQSQEALNILPGSSASATIVEGDGEPNEDSKPKTGVVWDLLGKDYVDGAAKRQEEVKLAEAQYRLAAQKQASRDKKELQMAIRTHKERNSTLTRLNSELNQELQEVMEQRIALEIQLEHLRPFSS